MIHLGAGIGAKGVIKRMEKEAAKGALSAPAPQAAPPKAPKPACVRLPHL